MIQETRHLDVAIVGGGLGGLATAALLARAGKRVAIIEQREHVGGRARSFKREGFTLNQGPHALYLGGPAERVLRSLEVALDGRAPPTRGAFAERDITLHTFPSGVLSLTTTQLMDAGEKLAFARFAAGVRSLRASALANVTVDEWLSDLKHERVRAVIRALVRVSSYAAATERMSAALAVTQLQRVASRGVIYLDGGWQQLVDQLRSQAQGAGCPPDFVQGRVHAIRSAVGGWSVEIGEGATSSKIVAREVVSSVGPTTARELLRDAGLDALAAFAKALPIHAATLDLGLSGLPVPSRTFSLGIDTPHYFSVHSGAAELTERGGVVAHAARYVHPDETLSHKELRAQLEDFVERVQPGYRERVVVAAFSPSMLVSNWLPTASTGGVAGRPPMTYATHPGLHFVGDWVGPEGHLLDASLHSADAAATRILRQGLAEVA